jgi:hypothetical protein
MHIAISSTVLEKVRAARRRAGRSTALQEKLEKMEARNDEVSERILKITLKRAGLAL